MLDNYDVISSRKSSISGHFTLLRNDDILNHLFTKVPNYKELLNDKNFQWFDEIHFDKYLKKVTGVLKLRCFWKKDLLNVENNMDSHQDYHLDRWLWKDGHLINTKTNEEIMYLHFINWKNSLKKNEVQYNIKLNSFFISFNKIHFYGHSNFSLFINNLKNLFFGYWIREKTRTIRYKIFSFNKRLLKYINKK